MLNRKDQHRDPDKFRLRRFKTMDSLRKRLVMFVTLVALVMLGSVLAAQPTPRDCEKECRALYMAARAACHGDATCLATARAVFEGCIGGCRHPRD
jgi:hypothetical protein